MNWLEAALLGLVQGLTEFLPISSSGHIVIGSEILGINSEENLTFTIVVHAATVLSTLVILFPEITSLIKGLLKFEWNDETKFVLQIGVSLVPIMIVGFFFKDFVEKIFGEGLLLVGIMLWVTAALLAFSHSAQPKQKKELSFRDALIIGVSQAVAVLPGLSRSGSTIATGILLGNSKETVAKFSFLMVIIPILGEAFLELLKGDFSTGASSIPTMSLVIGFLAAFISGCFACKWMIKLVKKGKLINFAYYCFIAGTIAIYYTLMKY